MAGRTPDSSFLQVIGGTVLPAALSTPFHRVCVFTISESSLEARTKQGLIHLCGSDPLAEAGGENSSSPPCWMLSAPLLNLDPALALSCLERHLRKRKNLISTTPLPSETTLNSKDELLLTYETNPTLEDDDSQLSKESFLAYLDAWCDIVYLAHGITTSVVDTPPTPQPLVDGRETTARAKERTRPPFKEQPAAEMAEQEMSLQKTEVIMAATEVLEGIEDGYEVEGPSNAGGDGGDVAFDRLNPRRSHRVLILDSIPKKKPIYQPPEEFSKKKEEKKTRKRPPAPAAQPKQTSNDNNEAGPSNAVALAERQSRFFNTRPMPKDPVPVICGDAEGLWDPINSPLDITVTEVGGNGSPQAVAAAAQLNRMTNKKLVVSCNQFEKIGGRAAHKNWKHSVRIKDPKDPITIAQFALEIGIPFEKRPRGPSGFQSSEGSVRVPRTLKEIEEYKLNAIKNALKSAGYSSSMAEKRLSSKRTFHGTHRSEHPGMYDWHLLLPTGKWIRSLSGIINNPKTPEMDEDDVIFSDEEGAGTSRAYCRRSRHCICVAGHAGPCCSGGRGKRVLGKKRKENGKDEDAGEDKVKFQSLEEIAARQKGDRKERWLKRQGLWSGDGDSDGGGNDEENYYADDDDSMGGDTEDYAVSFGFTRSRELDGTEEHQNDGGTSKILE